jgi:anti-sigma regulatory factor (Ser/Thr protein kinase)
MNEGRVIADETFPGRTDSVRLARDFVAEHLGDDPGAEMAVLLTSEAVTNSMLHSRSGDGGKVTVVLVELPGAIRIEVVDDGGPTVPTLGDDDPLGTGGRGLRLIDQLAADWSYFIDDAGLTTWFTIGGTNRV